MLDKSNHQEKNYDIFNIYRTSLRYFITQEARLFYNKITYGAKQKAMLAEASY